MPSPGPICTCRRIRARRCPSSARRRHWSASTPPSARGSPRACPRTSPPPCCAFRATGSPTASPPTCCAGAVRRGSAPLALLAVLGPGLLAGLSDDDPAGITTYSILGADYGDRLLWVLLLATGA